MNAADITRVYDPVANGTTIEDYVFNGEVDSVIAAHNLVVLDLQTLDDFLDTWNGATGYKAKVDANIASITAMQARLATDELIMDANTTAITANAVAIALNSRLQILENDGTTSYSPTMAALEDYDMLVFTGGGGAITLTLPAVTYPDDKGIRLHIVNARAATVNIAGTNTFLPSGLVLTGGNGEGAICSAVPGSVSAGWACSGLNT